jgi:hypothetical protein
VSRWSEAADGKPSTAEFKELAPELIQLAGAGERRRKDPQFIVP